MGLPALEALSDREERCDRTVVCDVLTGVRELATSVGRRGRDEVAWIERLVFGRLAEDLVVREQEAVRGVRTDRVRNGPIPDIRAQTFGLAVVVGHKSDRRS